MKRGYIPNQHGAWAMLAIPFLFGMLASQPTPLHALLFAGWLLVYLFTYPLLQWIKTRKAKLYARPAWLYGSLLVPAGAALFLLEPNLLRYAPLFLPLFAVNVYYARRNRERSLVNDLAAVVMFSLMVFIAYETGGGADTAAACTLFALSVLYFTGTVFYVKTIIRERGNPRYYRFSVVYHALLFVSAPFWLPLVWLLPLGVLLVRAAWSPRTRITAKRSGMLEIAYAILVVIAAVLA